MDYIHMNITLPLRDYFLPKKFRKFNYTGEDRSAIPHDATHVTVDASVQSFLQMHTNFILTSLKPNFISMS
eukprot:scaffold194_cov84-Skeletonema_dohrnii-CCMP3373.AAC.7